MSFAPVTYMWRFRSTVGNEEHLEPHINRGASIHLIFDAPRMIRSQKTEKIVSGENVPCALNSTREQCPRCIEVDPRTVPTVHWKSTREQCPRCIEVDPPRTVPLPKDAQVFGSSQVGSAAMPQFREGRLAHHLIRLYRTTLMHAHGLLRRCGADGVLCVSRVAKLAICCSLPTTHIATAHMYSAYHRNTCESVI